MNRDIYTKLIAKLKSIGTSVSGVETDTTQLKSDVLTLQGNVSDLQSATEFSKATLSPVSEDVEFLNYNYICKFGKIVIYHIAVRLKGTVETPIPASTWKDIMNIPSGFEMNTADQVIAIDLNTSQPSASAYYDSQNSKLQIYPYSAITANVGFQFLMVGEVKASA